MSDEGKPPEPGVAPRKMVVASGVLLYPERSGSRRLQAIRLFLARPFAIEVWLWALCLFLLTTPFTFTLMGQDPTIALVRDNATMRRSDGSQALLYGLRIGLFLFAVALSLLRWRLTARALARFLPIALMLGWSLLSVVWSDSPESTLHGFLVLFCTVMTGFLMGVRLPVYCVARVVIYSGLLMGLASVYEVMVVPSYGMHQINDSAQAVHAGAWRGVYLHKNHLGQLCAMYAAAILVAGPQVIVSQIFKWGLFGFMIFLIVMTTSASAIAMVPAAIFLLGIVVVFNPMQKLFATVAGFAGAIIGMLSLNILLAFLGRDPTVSGRTDIWAIAFEFIVERPLQGFGYMSSTYGGFTFELSRKIGVFDPHNGYLDIILGLGVIGLVLFFAVIVTSWIVARGVYLVGGSFRQGIVVLVAPGTAWLISNLTEANVRPLGAAAAIGFATVAAILAMPRSGVFGKLPIAMRSWEITYRETLARNENEQILPERETNLG